jgi:HEAT repeat protein
MEGIRQLFNRQKMPAVAYEILDAQSRVQLGVMDELDNYMDRIFSTACTTDDLKAYGPAFARLLKCGYSEKPQAILAALLGHLKRDDRNARRKAQFLLGRAVAAGAATQSWALLGWLADTMVSDVAAGEDTFEYSDLLAALGEQLLTIGRSDLLADLAHRLRETMTKQCRPADELVAQAVLKRWSRLHVVSVLMRLILKNERDAHADALKALQAIRGPEVARLAAGHLTHSDRRVRLTMIRLLPELGAAARDVCVELLAPEALWQRPAGSTSLPDESWYTVRNALHILGRLRQPDALAVLRYHLSDPDSRVRFEIVRALECIGGDDALRFLVTLAEDPEREVRLAAIVAIGAAGSEHEVFVLRELFGANPDSAEKIIYAIGHIGGRQAKEFLFALLDDDDEFRNAGLGERIRPLREVVLKALAQNPDAEIVERIEQYCREHNRTFRIPVVTDKLTHTARDTLRRALS